MLTAIAIGIACIVIGLIVGFGRSWLDGFEIGGWGDEGEGERRRDRELAREQAEVLREMRAASDQDDESDDDPFRER